MWVKTHAVAERTHETRPLFVSLAFFNLVNWLTSWLPNTLSSKYDQAMLCDIKDIAGQTGDTFFAIPRAALLGFRSAGVEVFWELSREDVTHHGVHPTVRTALPVGWVMAVIVASIAVWGGMIVWTQDAFDVSAMMTIALPALLILAWLGLVIGSFRCGRRQRQGYAIAEIDIDRLSYSTNSWWVYGILATAFHVTYAEGWFNTVGAWVLAKEILEAVGCLILLATAALQFDAGTAKRRRL